MCLDQLPRGQRRVLVLRAGIGPHPALSRRAVGGRLDLPLRSVRRTERRGLHRLYALERDGSCSGASSAPTLASAPLAAAPDDGPSAAARQPVREPSDTSPEVSGTAEGRPQSGVKGVLDSSPADRPALALPVPTTAEGREGLALILLLLGLCMFGWAVRRELRADATARPDRE